MGEFPQLFDPDGSVWERFRTGRSTFYLINDDGTVAQTSYGQLDEAGLRAEVQKLIDS